MAMRRNGNRARCQHDGCDKFAQTRGLCKAHGGGSRCRDPSCHKLAQSRGLCIAHGGGRRCQHEGCAKLAQSKGFCISHGGGRRCAVPDCKKFSQVRGRCKSHSKLALDRSEDDVELSSQDDLDADMPSPASSVRSVSPAPSPEQLRRRRRVKKENAQPATKLSIDFLVNPIASAAADAHATSARPALLAVGNAPASAPHHHLLLLQQHSSSSSSAYLDPSARWQEQHRRPSYPSPPAEFVLKNPNGCLDDDSLRAPPYAFAAGPPPRSLELEEKHAPRFDAPLSSRFQPPPVSLFGQRALGSPHQQLPAPPTSRSLLSFLDGPAAAASADKSRSFPHGDELRRPIAHAHAHAHAAVVTSTSTSSMTTGVVLPSLSHLNMR